MQFNIVTIALLATAASAADIVGWTGTSCNGRSVACKGIQENLCCNFGTAMRSIAWTLPPNSRGFGYTSNTRCASNRATYAVLGQQTNACFRYSSAVHSGAWFLGGSGSARIAKREEKDKDCASPNEYSYVMPDGKTVTKKIPEGKWEEVLKWIEDGETDKLEALETVSEGSD